MVVILQCGNYDIFTCEQFKYFILLLNISSYQKVNIIINSSAMKLDCFLFFFNNFKP